MKLPSVLAPTGNKPVGRRIPEKPVPVPPPGRTSPTINWTPVRQRTAARVQARGDKELLVKFMRKWIREDAP